jgi:hypothetical protein
MLTEQAADDPVPANVQFPPGVNVTVPTGVVGPVAMSVTVAVHVVACPMNTVDGLHATVVVVACAATVTVRANVPWLVPWFASPL